MHPEDRHAVAHEIQNIVEQGTEFDFTTRIVRPGGIVRHVRCVGRPAPTSGALPWFIGTTIDVTEHEQLTSALRKREDALRKREDELRQVVDLTPQVVAVYGPKCERVYANRWALAYFGTSLDDWLQAARRVRGAPRGRAAVDGSDGRRANEWDRVRAGDAPARRRRKLPVVSRARKPGA